MVTLRKLWLGDNTMSPQQFMDDICSGRLQIVLLPLGAMFLVTWGESNGLRLCRILTVVATDVNKDARADVVIPAFEKLAKEHGAQVVMSFGRKGYKDMVSRNGWTTDMGLLMRKELS